MDIAAFGKCLREAKACTETAAATWQMPVSAEDAAKRRDLMVEMCALDDRLKEVSSRLSGGCVTTAGSCVETARQHNYSCEVEGQMEI